MQASISYHTINGKIRSATYEPYTRSEALLTDALGSVVRTQDDYGGANFRYYAYGGLIKTTPGYLTPYIGWVGSLGYRETNLNHAEQYIRARHYSTTDARWTTVDPLWPDELTFVYIGGSPVNSTDPSGQQKFRNILKCIIPGLHCLPSVFENSLGCAECALDILKNWYHNPTHYHDHPYTHCMTCCTLATAYGPSCAIQMQQDQNRFPTKLPGTYANRMRLCKIGVEIASQMKSSKGLLNTQSYCSSKCSQRFPLQYTPKSLKKPIHLKPFPHLPACDPPSDSSGPPYVGGPDHIWPNPPGNVCGPFQQ